MEHLAIGEPGRSGTVVHLKDEPVESLVADLAHALGRVLAASPMGRPLSQAELGIIRSTVRTAVWDTLESIALSADGGRTATFAVPGGTKAEWTAGIAWHVALALHASIELPKVFEYLAEEFPAEAAAVIGFNDLGDIPVAPERWIPDLVPLHT